MEKNYKNIAFVHDWLNGMRGGEKVLEYLLTIFPNADIFTLHHDLNNISENIKLHKIFHSFIQNMPLKKKFYRWYLPLFPFAVKRFNLSDYDLVISTSHCAAKNVYVNEEATHICYCFSPIRYIWSLQDDYFGKNKLKKLLIKPIINYLKRWDYEGAKRVSKFIAISDTIKKRIFDCYRRDASVVFPPTDIDFSPNLKKKDFFLVLSALTPYKKIELAIKAASELNVSLKIAGSGPLINELKNISGSKVEFLGWISDDEKKTLLRDAKALIFPGFEDFGIVPLEAMRFCTPVIAYGKGGVSETVIHEKTGLLFDEQKVTAIKACMEKLDSYEWKEDDFENATKEFSVSVFIEKMKAEIFCK